MVHQDKTLASSLNYVVLAVCLSKVSTQKGKLLARVKNVVVSLAPDLELLREENVKRLERCHRQQRLEKFPGLPGLRSPQLRQITPLELLIAWAGALPTGRHGAKSWRPVSLC